MFVFEYITSSLSVYDKGDKFIAIVMHAKINNSFKYRNKCFQKSKVVSIYVDM